MCPLSIVHCSRLECYYVSDVNRGRNWAFIGYPGDSLPENYRVILVDELHLCFAESPVHDQDINPDGSPKKKHIHIVLSFNGNKSKEQIREISKLVNGTDPICLANLRGMVRYLIHADNPEKHQYRFEDIFTAGGFDVEEYFKKSNKEYRQVIKDIIKFLNDNSIDEFDELVNLVAEADLNDWFDVITCRNSVFFAKYLSSKHFRLREQKKDAQYEEYLDYLRQLATKSSVR